MPATDTPPPAVVDLIQMQTDDFTDRILRYT